GTTVSGPTRPRRTRTPTTTSRTAPTTARAARTRWSAPTPTGRPWADLVASPAHPQRRTDSPLFLKGAVWFPRALRATRRGGARRWRCPAGARPDSRSSTSGDLSGVRERLRHQPEAAVGL